MISPARILQYKKIANTISNADPCSQMVADVKHRLDEAQRAFLDCLVCVSRRRFLFLLSHPEEISRRIMRLAQLQSDYNQDLITIRRFSQLLRSLRDQKNNGADHGRQS